MSNKYLTVRNTDGLITNVIVWDGVDPFHIDGHTLIERPDEPVGVWVGWSYINGEWIAPEPEPESE